MATLAVNKIGRHNYDFLETIEAGIVLSGPEVKSAKLGQVSLRGSYVTIRGNDAYLLNCHIAPYKPAQGVQSKYSPTRPRRLLLKKRDILTLADKKRANGATLIPDSIYTKGSLVKVSVALARGKRKQDRRVKIKKKELGKELRTALKY